MTRPIVYTAIYGAYEQPKPAPPSGGLLLTDDEHLDAPGWTVHVDTLPHLPSPMLRAKWWKCHPELALPHAEATVWVDGSITVADDFTERCEQALSDHDIALTPHPWRDCIYDELLASEPLREKYDPATMRAQVEHYRMLGHPEHWGLFATGVIARRHTLPALELGDAWWYENATHSWQDQLSLPVLVRQREHTLRWAPSLPWGEWWHISGRGW